MIDNHSLLPEADNSSLEEGFSLPSVPIQVESTDNDYAARQSVSQVPLGAQSLRAQQSQNQKFKLVLLSVLASLPIIALAAILSLVLNQPFLALLLTGILTAILTSAIATQMSRPAQLPRIRSDALDLLEVENNRLNNQIQSLKGQYDFEAKKRQFLSSLGFRVRQVPTESMLFETAVNTLRELLRTDRVIVYKFNADWSGTVIAESVNNAYPHALSDVIVDPCFKQRHAFQYQNGRIRGIADIYEEPGMTDCYIRLLEQYAVRANLVVPIRQDEKLFGLLITHQCSGPRHWSDQDTELMTQLAAEMEYHLESIQTIQSQEASARHAWFLGDIAFRARQTHDIQDLLRYTVKGAREVLDTDRVMLYRFNPDWSGTMVAESVGADWPAILNEKIDDPCFKGPYVEKYKNGRVRAIHNLRQEPGLTDCHIRTLEKYGVKANLVAPVRQKNELVGLLIAHHCASPREWHKTDISFFSQTALQLEYALEHLSFIEKIAVSAERTRLFGDLAFRARQSLDAENVLRVAVQGALNQLKTDRVLFYRFNPDWSGNMTVEALASDRWPKVLDARIEDPCFKGRYVDLYKGGRVRAINDIHQEPGLTDCHVRTLEQYAVKANLVAPIRQENELYGLLIAHHCEQPRVWQQQEIDFFAELAIQVEYALDHIHFISGIEDARHRAESASQNQLQQTELIKHQLDALRRDVQGALQGDLTVRALPLDGDIGIFATFLNATIENLQHIVLQVQSAAVAVNHTAQVSEKNVTTLSSEALRQSDVIASTLDDIQNMSSSIQGVSANAQRAEQKVRDADQVLKEGDKAMDQTVAAISALQARVEETAQQVKLLGEASQSISRAVNLIRELASQTNVLALNAAIEAGSSGEHDQGFAVVAEEVRAIAERSTTATRQIEDIVEEIQTETNQVVTAMADWREQVIEGTLLVETTRQKLNSIASVSGEIRTLVEAIAQAALEQSHVSGTVANRMQEVKNIARENSAQSVIVADSLTQLLQVASQLQDSVAQFKAQ